MTFNNINEVISLLKSKEKACPWVVSARKTHKDLKALVLGDEFKDLLLKIEGIESDKRATAREKYSKSIKDVNARTLQLIDNVYSADGGLRDYSSIKPESSQKTIMKAITRNRDNKSLSMWLHTFWAKTLYSVDPNGVIFMEYLASSNKHPYPTYKSIDCIRSYEDNGQNLEWIIFEPYEVKINDNIIKKIRVVDDKMDYTFIIKENEFILDQELTFEHPFKQVPGLICSDIKKLGSKERLSFLDPVIDLEKELLRDKSILTLHKFLNGFIVPIRPAVVCPKCRGLGKDGMNKPCGSCDGTGQILSNDITDQITVPVSLDREESYNLPPGVFTYMEPPLEIWNQYIKEIDRAEIKINDTLWGTHKEKFETERTAFETFVDTQPVIIKLSVISEVAEFMEWQLTEWIINYFEPNNDEKNSIVISYGKNFIIEPSEAIMEKYRQNKKEGVSIAILDRQLFEYINSKYKNNPEVLRKELLKKELDYYVHYTLKEVYDYFGTKEARKKMLFTDWWEQLDKNIITNKSIDQIKVMRDTWIEKEVTKLTPESIINNNGNGDNNQNSN